MGEGPEKFAASCEEIAYEDVGEHGCVVGYGSFAVNNKKRNHQNSYSE